MFVVIIANKNQRRQNPCHRITENNHRDCRTDFQRYGKPDNPQYTDTAKCNDDRDNHIPDSPQCPRQNLNKHVNDIPRSNQNEHIASDLNNVGIRRKHPEQKTSCSNQKYDHYGSRHQLHPQTHLDAFPDPVCLTRAKILPDKSSNGNAKSRIDHPENCVQLSISRPCRCRIRPERI